MRDITDFFGGIFDTSLWPRRWRCGEWSEFHGWLYILSDLMIGLAYTGIPLIIMAYLIKKEKAVPFPHLFFLFGAFIFFCGLTHFMDATIFWWPAYRLSAILRFATAIVSIVTLYALFKILPDAFSLKTSIEFENELSQRKQAEAELKLKNKEMIKANLDLESFSYSVSHDLRAPLRAINAYSSFIFEDNYDQLDDKGKSHVNNIMANVEKMDHLIIDLLKFSKISRQDLKRININMNHLVKDLISNIQRDYPNKKYEVQIDELPDANADQSMVRQLLENLISNAFKYSQFVSNPKIHIGSNFKNNHNEYFVKDNGDGFDMGYVGKIFQVFQRLHSDQQFPGTGVGMAIASKIVDKHGGSIRAEGEKGKGATFYFILENN
jgi:two-component system, chemotaxis family, sensor kinase Cph1